MLLNDVREWIESMDIADQVYMGRLDNKQDKSFGVYPRQRQGMPVTAIGGLSASSYDIMPITVLVHWNRKFRETEAAAYDLWDRLTEVTNLDVGDQHIDYLALQVPSPVFVNTDDNGVYEYVIDFDIYFRRI